MIPPRFKLYFQTYKKTLLLLVLAQLACVALYAAAMKVLASITDSVFLKQKTFIQAAPVLLVLLFLLIFWEITRYLQKQLQHIFMPTAFPTGSNMEQMKNGKKQTDVL